MIKLTNLRNKFKKLHEQIKANILDKNMMQS